MSEALQNTLARLTTLLKEKDEKIAQLEKNQNNVMQFQIIRNNENTRQVVRLYAKGYSSGFIFNILNKELGISMSLEDIDSIIRDIEGDKVKVDKELIEIYIEEKDLVEKEEQVSKGLFAQTLYKKLRLLENSYSKCWQLAEEAGDYKEARMALDSLTKLAKEEAQIFSKNILNIFSSGKKNSLEDEEYKTIKDKFINNPERKTIVFKAVK